MNYIDISNLGKTFFLNERLNQDFYVKIITKTKQYNYLVKGLKIYNKDYEEFKTKTAVKVYTKTNISFYVENFNHSFMYKECKDFSRSIKIYTDRGSFELIDFYMRHYPPSLHEDYRLIHFEVDSRIGKVKSLNSELRKIDTKIL